MEDNLEFDLQIWRNKGKQSIIHHDYHSCDSTTAHVDRIRRKHVDSYR